MATDNELLSEILDAVTALGAVPYIVSGTEDIAVTDASTSLRAASEGALKTVIVNTGEEKMEIYEGGKLVAILYEDEAYVSDLQGNLAYTAICDTGLASVAAITTYTPAA